MTTSSDTKQHETLDQFLYYFMRIRKCRCRMVVSQLKKRHPKDTPIQLARHLVHSQTVLSFAGGALSRVPEMLPSTNKKSLRVIGIAGGGYALTAMHMHLILEIAYLFGKDIDDKQRIPEMIAVITATVPAMTVHPLDSTTPLLSVLSRGLLPAVTAKLIGEVAIAYYTKMKSSTVKDGTVTA